MASRLRRRRLSVGNACGFAHFLPWLQFLTEVDYCFMRALSKAEMSSGQKLLFWKKRQDSTPLIRFISSNQPASQQFSLYLRIVNINVLVVVYLLHSKVL